MQTEILFLHGAENNRESETHYEANLTHFSKQAQLVFDLLMGGKELTSFSAMTEHYIMHLARRKKDLTDAGILISERWENNCKVWYMSQENINQNKHIYDRQKG